VKEEHPRIGGNEIHRACSLLTVGDGVKGTWE
jgi:hypothetical protein